MPLDVPWRDLPEAARETVLRGKGGFAGVMGFFAQMERKKYKLHVRVMLSKYRGYAECPDCRGQRLRAEARAVRIGADDGKNICQATALTIAQAKEFFDALKLSPMQEEIAGPILTEVRQRLELSGRSGAGIPDARPAGFDALAAARRSGFNWRLRWARGWWARSTCSMSLRSDCTRATRRG